MKLSVFTVATPDLTPDRLAAAAQTAGLDGIEWRFKEIPDEARQEPYSFWRNNICSIDPRGGGAHFDSFAEAARRHGLENVSVTPYLQPGDLEATEHVLRVAKRIGASFIRLGVHGYNRTRPFGELFESERAYLREAAELCKQYGVKGLVETHHVTIAPSASAAYRLVEGLDPDDVGVLFDPGNMVHEGFENFRMGMEILGPYLAHVHVKNAGWKETGADEDGSVTWTCSWTGIRKGVVPWKQVIEDLKAVGYGGYLGVEDFSGELGSEALLRDFADYMKRLLDS